MAASNHGRDFEGVARDRIGQGMRAVGRALEWLGLELCGLSGWWDAGTDSRRLRKEGRRVAEARGHGRSEG